MLLIKITDPDGTDPIILEQVENKSLFKALNTADEGVSFEVAKNSPKAEVLNPDTSGYNKFWEAWDTETNERLNRGPITEITESGPNWKVTGAGRSALLKDFYSTKKTFYAPIDVLVDELRFENIAVEPRTTTLAGREPVTVTSIGVEGNIDPDSKYGGLSKNTKDNAIDDNTGQFRPGQIEPINTYYTTDSFWAGMSKTDSLIVDLGDDYPITKAKVLLPWWGGIQRWSNRTYDFTLGIADAAHAIVNYRNRPFSSFSNFYDTGNDSRLQTPLYFYFGRTASGTSYDWPTFYALQNQDDPPNIRYFRVAIRDVHAWSGTVLDGGPPVDVWDYQCDPSYQPGDNPGISSSLHGIMEGKTISDRVLEPQNDCYASVVEIGLYREIISRDTVKPLALQKIDNNNLQITYSHAPVSGEMETTSEGYRKFEPGGFFRKFSLTWSGAGTNYTKFYDSDCTNCYPDGFHLGIVDQNNTLVYSSDSSSGSATVKTSAYSNTILIKGASNATVTSVDSWPAVVDPLSWGGSYSYSKIANDYAILHFRGQSLKWFATVPSTETGATVKIEIRHKGPPRLLAVTGIGWGYPSAWDTEAWTSWTTLENSYKIPDNISNELVYEITYESGYLLPDTVYEIRITNLDGNYASIDSFEGYWSSSMTSYNEDNKRINISRPENLTQIYDKRFSGGSMYKWNKSTFFNFSFEGDRVIFYSAKGHNHGKMALVLMRRMPEGSIYDPDAVNNVRIPGGDSNGVLTINLESGARGSEVTQYIAFDSNDYFPDGLPWDNYTLGVYTRSQDISTFSTTDSEQFNNFVPRCNDCVTPTGDPVTINKFVFLDGVAAHEKVGLSVNFETQTHLDILKSIAEAIQAEWDVTEQGIRLEPRLGVDTNEVLREGHNTLVNYNLVNDVTQIASMLISNGSDIDGLPLYAITEDKKTRALLGRTVMRQQDFREIADYFQLIGLSRTELRKRRYPDKRISVTHIAQSLSLDEGDSFILYTKKQGPLRVRIMRKQRTESASGGTSFDLECIKWPQII